MMTFEECSLMDLLKMERGIRWATRRQGAW